MGAYIFNQVTYVPGLTGSCEACQVKAPYHSYSFTYLCQGYAISKSYVLSCIGFEPVATGERVCMFLDFI